MPANIPQQPWFDPNWYAQQKFLQHNVMYPDDQWTSVEQYNQELAKYNATNWENWFTEYGNADNVSPNRLFDEAYYFTALAASSNAARTAGREDWTPTTIKDYLKQTYNASGWDHYTAQGQFEGLNPSAAFDTTSYFQIRVAMLNAYNNGAGWDNHGWTVDMYKDVMRGANINPIMDLFLNTDYGKPDATQKIAPVQNPLTPPENWNPWGEGGGQEPVWEPEATKALTSEVDTVEGAAGVETLFTAVVSSGKDNTLNAKDQIHADAKVENHLDVLMKDNFNPGFSGVDGKANVTGVEVVTLTNESNASFMFDTRNIEGVDTWNLVNKANTSVLNLWALPEAGITVNIQGQKQGTADINFTNDAIKNAHDAMTLGLANVGSARGDSRSPIAVSINGIEELTVASTGSATNYVNLKGAAQATTLAVQGSAALWVGTSEGKAGLSDKITAIDADAAKGDLYINASDSTNLKTVDLGSGNDTLIVKSMNTQSTIEGGSGQDALIFDAATPAATYKLNMSGVETLAVHNTATSNNLTFDGTNTTGLTTLNLVRDSAAVTLENFNESSLTVNILGKDSPKTDAPAAFGDLTVNDITNITVNLGDSSASTSDVYAKTLTFEDATSLTLNLLPGGSTPNQTSFRGHINAGNVTSLTVNTQSQNSIFGIDEDVSAVTHLEKVANLTVSGEGNINFAPVNIGQDAQSLVVSGNGMTGDFWGKFKGDASVNNQSLTVTTGSGEDCVKVNNTYKVINITTGSGKDIVDLSAFDNFDSVQSLYINLGGDTGDTIYVGSGLVDTFKSKFGNSINGADVVVDTLSEGGYWGFTAAPVTP